MDKIKTLTNLYTEVLQQIVPDPQREGLEKTP